MRVKEALKQVESDRHILIWQENDVTLFHGLAKDTPEELYDIEISHFNERMICTSDPSTEGALVFVRA